MVKFQTEKVTDRITRIYGITGEQMYVVAGDKKAAIIDTMSGIGKVRPVVESVTDKEQIVLLTHGHVDHAMGAPEFDCPVYINQAERSVYEEHSDMNVRKGSLQQLPKEITDKIMEQDFVPVRPWDFLPLNEGDSFDLGGITIQTYLCPGHTPGSAVFLLKEERILLTGDACNPFTFLFFEYCPSIPEYKKNLENLKSKTDGMYDRVLLSHGTGEGPVTMLSDVIEVCDDITGGKSDDIPFEFMGSTAFIAKEMTPEFVRKDGKVGNIVYRK